MTSRQQKIAVLGAVLALLGVRFAYNLSEAVKEQRPESAEAQRQPDTGKSRGFRVLPGFGLH